MAKRHTRSVLDASAFKLSGDDSRRTLHELQVHQIELEMQNAELRDAREQTEAMLEKYSNLYEFAPVGYFTLAKEGLISEVNLTGSVLLGIDRKILLSQRLEHFVVPSDEAAFLTFIEQITAGDTKATCEVKLRGSIEQAFWADMHGKSTVTSNGLCISLLIAISDISTFKRAVDAQHRMEELAISNQIPG